ncbi:MAG: phosphotransferase, partial [Candidatus Hermodarchaeota archaeon]
MLNKPKRPNLSDIEVLRLINDLYGITGSVQELPSERDQNFYVKTENGKEYVLKIANTFEEEETLDLQNKAMLHLEDLDDSERYPLVLLTKSNELIATYQKDDETSHFVRLVTFLPGKVLAEVNPHNTELLYDFGCFVGTTSSYLETFTHTAANRDLYWDLKHAYNIINKYKEHIADLEKRMIVEHFLNEFTEIVLPNLSNLRTSVIHNDFNDYNVIVNRGKSPDQYQFGIIDFGDMIYSHTIFELAVATTYAILGKKNPIKAAAHVISGYHSVFPLNELELELLFILICTRLCMSVSIAAYQQKLEPENEYLKISEKPAWETLKLFKDVHPRLANYVFRHACKMFPCPQSKKIVDWIKLHSNEFGLILGSNFDKIPHVVFDLSIESLELNNLYDFTNKEALNELLLDKMKNVSAKVGIGRYNEARAIYTEKLFRSEGDEGFEYRTIHLGSDLFLKPNSPLYTPLEGRIHSFQNNKGYLDYGPTIILEHEINDGKLKFFTLYGHLSLNSLNDIEEGRIFKKGELLAHIGSIEHNGGWPPHLHFQIIIDMLGRKGDFPGVISESQRDIWLSICPDPNLILKI